MKRVTASEKPITLLRSIIVTNFSGLAILILNFIYVPFLIDHTSSSDYALWRLFFAITSYLFLSDLGLGSSLIYFINRYRSSHDNRALAVYLTSILYSYLAIATVVASTTLILAPSIVHFFGLERGNGLFAIRVAGLASAVAIVGAMFGGILQAHQQYGLNSLITLGTNAIGIVASFGVIVLGFGIRAVIALTIVQILLGSVARCIYSRKYERISAAPKNFSKDMFRRSINYGSWTFLIVMAGRMSLDTTDTLIIARALPLNDLAIYSIAVAPLGVLSVMVYRSVDVLFPRLAMDEPGESNRANMFQQTMIVVAIVTGAGIFSCISLGRDVIHLWVGPSFEGAYVVMVFMAAAFAFDYLAHICTVVMMSMNRHSVVAKMRVGQGVVNIILSYTLAMAIGVQGVALGSLIVMVPLYGFLLPKATCEAVGEKYSRLLPKIGLPWVSALVLSGMWLALLEVFALGLVGRLAFSITGMTAYLIIAWKTVLPTAQKNFIAEKARWIVIWSRVQRAQEG